MCRVRAGVVVWGCRVSVSRCVCVCVCVVDGRKGLYQCAACRGTQRPPPAITQSSGLVPYGEAWRLQQALVAQRIAWQKAGDRCVGRINLACVYHVYLQALPGMFFLLLVNRWMNEWTNGWIDGRLGGSNTSLITRLTPSSIPAPTTTGGFPNRSPHALSPPPPPHPSPGYDALLVLEHAPVYTLGRSAKAEDVRFPLDGVIDNDNDNADAAATASAGRGFDVRRVNRVNVHAGSIRIGGIDIH